MRQNDKKLKDFIGYLTKPLSIGQIDYLNKLNSVNIEKVELYHDFIISLMYIINDTYLGDDIIDNEAKVVKHFNWCWSLNIENFKKENINIIERGVHYYYYLDYFITFYYNIENKDTQQINKIREFWGLILTMNQLKSKSEYDIFIEIYKIQDKYSLK